MKIEQNRKVGIIGDGQLALMLANAASMLNINTICFGSNEKSPASYSTDVIIGDISDKNKFNHFLQSSDIITYETENIDTTAIEDALLKNKISPNLDILKICQNRFLEKNMLNSLGIATTPFRNIETKEELYNNAKEFNYQCILKTSCFGYDGKGQVLISSIRDVELAWQILHKQLKSGLIVEKKVNFDCELSIIAVRDNHGHIEYYPLVQNLHKAGILRLTLAPYIYPSYANELQKQAEDIISTVMNKYNYIGVMCIELFKVEEKLLVNEIAPRVHNSGHWTIEGCRVSQFENHIRAITNLNILPPEPVGYSAMYNCISSMQEYNIVSAIKAMDNINTINLHDYHKQARDHRKLGHITLNTESKDVYMKNLQKLNAIFQLNNQ